MTTSYRGTSIPSSIIRAGSIISCSSTKTQPENDMSPKTSGGIDVDITRRKQPLQDTSTGNHCK